MMQTFCRTRNSNFFKKNLEITVRIARRALAIVSFVVRLEGSV
jgi:hypothetical protein